MWVTELRASRWPAALTAGAAPAPAPAPAPDSSAALDPKMGNESSGSVAGNLTPSSRATRPVAWSTTATWRLVVLVVRYCRKLSRSTSKWTISRLPFAWRIQVEFEMTRRLVSCETYGVAW